MTNPNIKPRLLITATPLAAVLAHAQRYFDVTVWDEPPFGADKLLAHLHQQRHQHQHRHRHQQAFDALIVIPGHRLDAATLAALPTSIKALGTYSVGLDHIDLAAATARGLPVFHTPDVLTQAVADLTLFLVIAAARRTSTAERTLREGGWGAWSPTFLLGRGLQGRRLGILGMGRIGQAVAQRARAFGMLIHYHNRRRLAADLEVGAIYHDSLDALMPQSDVLCVCAPAAPELRGAINAQRLSLLPAQALLVNVARGDLIDEDALFSAIAQGQVAGVAMDVYRNEPNIDPRWLALPEATLLPHLGSATEEARTAMGCLAVDGVASCFGLPVQGVCANPAVLDTAQPRQQP